jgi:uncharacterized protein YcfL
MMRNLTKIGAALLAGSLVTACSSPAPAPEPHMSNVDESHPRAKLIVGSSELLGTVRLGDPRFRKLGVLTQAQVELENYSDFDLDLQYRIDWRDINGFRAGNNGAWQFLSLSGNSTEYVTATGKVPEAEDITVTVRLPSQMFESTDDENYDENYDDYEEQD